MQLDEYLDMNELVRLIDQGMVSVREHEDFPLRIFNYTKKASGVRADNWPDALIKCRGLIVNNDDQVIAVGLRKFWNYDPNTGNVPVGKFTASDKMDGSLGIVYKWDGVPYIATRGSFHSEMAEWANKFLDEHPDYRQWLDAPFEMTPHVEIVYHANRIVVDYDYEDLVLLGYNDIDGWTPARSSWTYPGRIAETFDVENVQQLIDHERENTEGYVIQDERGTMLKIKGQHYIDLHRAVSNMTLRAVFNKFKEGGREAVEDFILDLPNEFQDEAGLYKGMVYMAYSDAEYAALFAANTIMTLDKPESRKDWALMMQQDNTPGWIRAFTFAFLDDNKAAMNKAIVNHIADQF